MPDAGFDARAGSSVGQQHVTQLGADEVLILAQLARIVERLEVDVNQVLEALEDVAEAVPPGARDAAAQLSEHDQAALREAGLLCRPKDNAGARAPARAALRYAQALANGLTVKEAAARLGVSQGRVRQRLGDGSLYGIQSKQGWRLPQYQFGLNGKTLPGLELVLSALPDSLHPLSVEGFFTRLNSELETAEGAASVAGWLAAGEDPEVVTELARDLLLTA